MKIMQVVAPTCRLLIVALALTIMLIGCGGDSGSGPSMTAADFAEQGWEHFSAGDYSKASLDFEEAIDTDSTYADGFLGAGYAHYFLNNFPTALARFVAIKIEGSDTTAITDFQAGRALAYLELNQYEECIKSASACLSLDDYYVFDRLPSINRTDIKVAQAQAYFLIGGDSNLVVAAGIVNEVESSTNLDPEDPSSWRVKGQQYESFSEALLRALEMAIESARRS